MIKAEVQPISGIIGLLTVLLFRIKRNVYAMMIVLFISLVVIHLALFVFRGASDYSLLFDGLGYLIPPLVFLAVYDKVSLLSVKAFLVAFGLYLLVGLLQHFQMIPADLESVLRILIPRFRATPLGGPRGVPFLAPEPSFSAFVILLFLSTAHYFYAVKRMKSMHFKLALLLVVIMLLLNKSGSILLFLGIYSFGYLFGLLVASKRREVVVLRFVLIMLVSVVLFSLVLRNVSGYAEGLSQVRFIQVTSGVVELLRSEQSATYILSEVGAKRFLTVIAGYYGVFDSFGLGHGIGSWSQVLEELAEKLGFSEADLPYPVVSPEKPDSYAAQVALEMGLPGLLLIILFLGRFVLDTVRSSRKGLSDTTPAKYAMICVAIFMILFFSTTALPIPWLVLCYLYDMNRRSYAQAKPRGSTAIAKPVRGSGTL